MVSISRRKAIYCGTLCGLLVIFVKEFINGAREINSFNARIQQENRQSKAELSSSATENGKSNNILTKLTSNFMARGDVSSIENQYVICKYPKWNIVCNQNEAVQFAEGDYFLLYSAYLTSRFNNDRSVLVIGIRRNPYNEQNLFCVLRYKNGIILSVKATKDVIKDTMGKQRYGTTLLWCSEPTGLGPGAVAIATAACGELSNILPVLGRLPRQQAKTGIAVCLQDSPSRSLPAEMLVEWIEIQRLTGIKTVIMYVDRNFSDKEEKVVKYYEKEDILLTHFWNQSKVTYIRDTRAANVAAKNDCLYRFSRQYKYLVFMSTKDLILPSRTALPTSIVDTVRHLAEVKNTKNPGEVTIFSALFCLQNQSQQHFFLTNTKRGRTNREHTAARYIVNPASVVKINMNENELLPDSTRIEAPPEIVKVHFYQILPESSRKKICNIEDKAAERLKENLTSRLTEVLKKFSFG